MKFKLLSWIIAKLTGKKEEKIQIDDEEMILIFTLNKCLFIENSSK